MKKLSPPENSLIILFGKLQRPDMTFELNLTLEMVAELPEKYNCQNRIEGD